MLEFLELDLLKDFGLLNFEDFDFDFGFFNFA